jgi:rhamnulokinase
MGLWLLQQARAVWERTGRSYSYPELVSLAEAAPPGGPLVDPNDEVFTAPDDMVKEIRSFCRATGQELPKGPPAVVRCILESLALSYGCTLGRLSSILGRTFDTVHVVGGGSQNALLNQFTADATGLPVYAGPVEATVAGNVLVQALATGRVTSPQEIRRIVRQSFPLAEYQPREAAYWEDRREEYEKLLGQLY